MDKRILTPEELEQLKRFITSRSQRFAEPVVLLEITDHFACKTEELLTENPNLSFDMALKKAHHSFGVKGFGPIAATCEERLYSNYKRAHRQAQQKVLLSPHGLGLLAIGLLAAQLHHWLRYSGLSLLNGFWGILLLEVCFLSGVLLIWSRKKSVKKQHPLVFGIAYAASNNVFGWLWFGVILLPVNYTFAGFGPILTGCLTFLLSLQLLALYRLRRKVDADVAQIDQKMQLGATG